MRSRVYRAREIQSAPLSWRSIGQFLGASRGPSGDDCAISRLWVAPVTADRSVLLRHRFGVLGFYVVAVASAIGEGIVVRSILTLSDWAGVHEVGPWLAWTAFAMGGTALGLLELQLIAVEEGMRNPILRACCWSHERLGSVGFVLNATVLGGAPGTAVALKRGGSDHQVALTVLAAALFATAWVPLYIWIWP
jgi:hypothetical protein